MTSAVARLRSLWPSHLKRYTLGRHMALFQVFERWMPFDEASGSLLLEGLVDTGDSQFRLLFRTASDPTLQFSLRWPDRPLAYRNIDESFRLRLWDTFHTNGHLFWIVRHSSWVREFHEESQHVRSHLAIVHYAVYTGDDCIDVLSASPPISDALGDRVA